MTQRIIDPGGDQKSKRLGCGITAVSRFVCLFSILAACLPSASWADVRPEIGSSLAQVKTLMQQSDYEGAQMSLRAMERMRDLNGHESAQIWDLYGSIYQAQGRYGLSIRAYESVLTQEGIPNGLAARAARALADLHAAQNNPGKALEYLNQWAALSAPAGVQAQRSKRPNPGRRPTLASPGPSTVGDSLSDQFVPNMDGLALPSYEEGYKAIVRVSPVYPRKAIEQGLEGYVVVECTVSKTGSVVAAKVAESTNRIFDRAAVRAIKKFKFTPRMVNGEYVEVTGVRHKINFQLE